MHWWKLNKVSRLISFSIVIFNLILQGTITFAQNNAVLSSGDWIKVGITESGIYKIEASSLQKLGWKIGTIKPTSLKIYGNGGSMLPQANKVARPADLLENAVLMIGEEDGVLDSKDALYFYAEGPHVVQFDSIATRLFHQNNVYTDTSYYFITHGGAAGKRIQQSNLLKEESKQIITAYDDYWYHETEQYNLLHSGREWWGDYMGLSALVIPTNLTNIVSKTPITVSLSAIASAQVSTNIAVSGNNQKIGEGTFGTVFGQTYTQRAQQFKGSFKVNLTTDISYPFNLSINYDNKGQLSAQAFLDYVGLQSKRSLLGYNQQQVYRFVPDHTDTLTYSISNIGTAWQLWDISKKYTPSRIVNNGNNDTRFTLSGGKTFRQFIGFNLPQAKVPVSWQQVKNQNIDQNATAELLIISPPNFVLEANRLADYRQNVSGLLTSVVTTHEIYNQYGSGKPDVTAIRDFVRHLYRKGEGTLKYVLLFGDATYDYKNILKNQSLYQRQSWVPVYESRESLQPVYTYSSDDYYGFLDEEEGEWVESQAGDHLLDIGIGRLPVKTVQEAAVVVDKLIHYDSQDSKGNWRSKIEFVADDGDNEIHQSHADQLSKMIGDDFLTKKIFLDAYPQISVSNGQRVPAVNTEIKNAINRGSLILNYTGHGGVSGWAQEQVLTLTDMLSARGNNNLPLLVTATCDFGRYDDLSQVSGAELMVLSPKGAAIGALITTRPVYSSTNFLLNSAMYKAIQARTQEVQRLGDLVKTTKNNALVGSLNRNFTLLGDPSMVLLQQSREIAWKAIPDTMRALEKVTMHGAVTMAPDSMLDNDFNGTAFISVFGPLSSFSTLGDEGDKVEYKEYRNKIFEGVVSVKNGLFTLEFVVPKDIGLSYGVGRISVYAVDSERNIDISKQHNLLVGGDASVEPNGSTVSIDAYLNDPSFKNGDTVTPDSDMFVKIETANGVNLSNTDLSHRLTAVLNDTLELVLNDYFVADLDNYKNGTIYFPFENLPQGTYTVLLKVWDTYNNFSNYTFGFVVGKRNGIGFTSRLVYPNPFQNEWNFELEHDRENDDIEVEVKIMSVSGAILGVEKWKYFNAAAKIKEGVKSPNLSTELNINQLYIYSIEIKSLTDNSVSRKSGKLFRTP